MPWPAWWGGVRERGKALNRIPAPAAFSLDGELGPGGEPSPRHAQGWIRALSSAASLANVSTTRCNGRRRCSGRLGRQRNSSECWPGARARPQESASRAQRASVPTTGSGPPLDLAAPRRQKALPEALRPANAAPPEQHAGEVSSLAQSPPPRSLLLRHPSRSTPPSRRSPRPLPQARRRVFQDQVAFLPARLLGHVPLGPRDVCSQTSERCERTSGRRGLTWTGELVFTGINRVRESHVCGNGQARRSLGRGPAHRLKAPIGPSERNSPLGLAGLRNSTGPRVEPRADSLISSRDFKTRRASPCALSGKFLQPRPRRLARAVGQHHRPAGDGLQPPSIASLAPARGNLGAHRLPQATG